MNKALFYKTRARKGGFAVMELYGKKHYSKMGKKSARNKKLKKVAALSETEKK